MIMGWLAPKQIKVLLRGILYVTLLILFYTFYMKSALEKFLKKSKTITQSQSEAIPDQPVLIICPHPPFKPSFFKKHNIDFNEYIWAFPTYLEHRQKLENGSSTLELYMNMVYKLGIDWNISVYSMNL